MITSPQLVMCQTFLVLFLWSYLCFYNSYNNKIRSDVQTVYPSHICNMIMTLLPLVQVANVYRLISTLSSVTTKLGRMKDQHALALPCGNTTSLSLFHVTDVHSFVPPAVGPISNNVEKMVVKSWLTLPSCWWWWHNNYFPQQILVTLFSIL